MPTAHAAYGFIAINFEYFLSALAPSSWIRRWSHLLPAETSVLDVACGSGRHLQWFARQGHAVLGLDRNAHSLEKAGVFGPVLACDLEAAAWPLAGQKFGAVVVTHYLWRPLLPVLIDSLAPGGVLLYETFADGQQSLGKPSNPDYLLRPGELLGVCAGLHVVAYENGVLPFPQRVVQRIAAVRSAGTTALADTGARWALTALPL